MATTTRLSVALEHVRAHGHDSSDVLGPSRSCGVARACARSGASVEAIVFGCSYVQRLARIDTRLRAALAAATTLKNKRREICVDTDKIAVDADLRLFAIVYVIAIGIATKIHGKKFSNFARAVLDDRLGICIPEDIAYDVEAEILRRLGWRLQAIARVDP